MAWTRGLKLLSCLVFAICLLGSLAANQSAGSAGQALSQREEWDDPAVLHVSVYEDDHIYPPSTLNLDFDKQNLFVTFEGLISRTPFVRQLQTILRTLQEKMSTPVDIEFAHDGRNLYLLQ